MLSDVSLAGRIWVDFSGCMHVSSAIHYTKGVGQSLAASLPAAGLTRLSRCRSGRASPWAGRRGRGRGGPAPGGARVGCRARWRPPSPPRRSTQPPEITGAVLNQRLRQYRTRWCSTTTSPQKNACIHRETPSNNKDVLIAFDHQPGRCLKVIRTDLQGVWHTHTRTHTRPTSNNVKNLPSLKGAPILRNPA